MKSAPIIPHDYMDLTSQSDSHAALGMTSSRLREEGSARRGDLVVPVIASLFCVAIWFLSCQSNLNPRLPHFVRNDIKKVATLRSE